MQPCYIPKLIAAWGLAATEELSNYRNNNSA